SRGHHGISSPVASLPVGGSTVFAPSVLSTSWTVGLGPAIAAGSAVGGNRVPSAFFVIQYRMMKSGACVPYLLDQSRELSLITGTAFVFLYCRIIAIFSTNSETLFMPESELVAHVYLFMWIGSQR